jgi:hypothetical protein
MSAFFNAWMRRGTRRSGALFWPKLANVTAVALGGLALCAGIVASAQASSLDFRVVTLQARKCGDACPRVITAEGDIDEHAPDRFLSFIRQNVRDKRVKNVVFLHSPGGQVVSALKLGLNMRQFGTAVVVARVREGGSDDPNGQFGAARCMSACVFVLMGGKKRVVPEQSLVGIHRMFREEFGPDPAGGPRSGGGRRQRMFASGSMVDVVSRYTSAMGISPQLIEAAEKVSPDSIHIVTPQEMARWRLGAPNL